MVPDIYLKRKLGQAGLNQHFFRRSTVWVDPNCIPSKVGSIPDLISDTAHLIADDHGSHGPYHRGNQ